MISFLLTSEKTPPLGVTISLQQHLSPPQPLPSPAAISPTVSCKPRPLSCYSHYPDVTPSHSLENVAEAKYNGCSRGWCYVTGVFLLLHYSSLVN